MSKTKGASIKPLFDYVLVKPLQQETTTPSGIVLPDTVKEKPQIGEVMAIGPGSECCGDDCCGEGCCKDKEKHGEMIVKVGQRVLYKKWGGNEVKVGPEEWLLIEQKDIMALVE